jgi:amidophosphoribosyltransferase
MSANNINQTELVALLINMGNTFVEGINNVYRKIDGSCSMLILTEDGIIAARDFLGRTPIVLGRKEGAYAVSSETASFPNLDYKIVRDLGPGEIVRLHNDGFEVMQPAFEREQICSFLWVYYGFPASNYEGINVEAVRERNGRMMGESDDSEVDCVCGVPDSGVGMALGYAEGKGVPYERAVLKYTPTWPRSFTPGNQSRRDLVAKMKLIPNAALLKDRRVVFCDDSIVRGTQLRDNVRTFFEYGAKEVHCRISCPPLVYGCPFIGFTASKSDLELITRQIIRDFEGDDKANLDKYSKTDSPEYKRMVEEIARRLGLSSLKFAKLEDLIESIGMPKCKVCTHCFDGTSYNRSPETEKYF